MPSNPDFSIPEEYQNRVLQATLKFGDDFIRMSDCGPRHILNAPESERISLALETDVNDIKFAYRVLSEGGRIGIPFIGQLSVPFKHKQIYL